MASLSSSFLKGHDNHAERLGDYQNGAVAIAKSSGHMVLPVYHNAGKLWPKGSFIKKPGIVTVIIGEPISASNGSAAEITEKIRNWTLEQAKKLE